MTISAPKHARAIAILQHDGGELANQLWNHVSVLAYACEQGYELRNYSFFEHAKSFESFARAPAVVRFFAMPYEGKRRRKSSLLIKNWRRLYKVLVVAPVSFFNKNRIIYSTQNENITRPDPYYLPPSAEPTSKLAVLERSAGPFYFSSVSGGVFRNPDGIARHRERITAEMRPASRYADQARAMVEPLRAQYKYVVGLHIRQTDYKTFKGGKYFVGQQRAVEIATEFLQAIGRGADQAQTASETCFIITSDEEVDASLFASAGLHAVISRNDVVADVFTLALCDAVLGSDSTLGHFAAYYGNIPHVIMKNEPMDWAYYAGKRQYFPNKYLTIMHY